MDALWRTTIDAYMKVIRQMAPQGALLERVNAFEREFAQVAESHPGEMDIVSVLARTGIQQKYNTLYMECQAGANARVDFDAGRELSEDSPRVFNAAKENRLPTVHEFIDTYRVVWEAQKEFSKPETERAYQALFDVENRTDDLVEAQMIIEREHLLVKLVTAGIQDAIEEFCEASDPNFELTSVAVNNTLRRYLTAGSIDEITWLSETARATSVDAAVQAQAKMSMLTNLNALLFAWEDNKRRIHTGDGPVDRLAMSMVLVRKKTRDLYRFLSEDLGLTFDAMMRQPFYRIMLLQPEGLDALWRVKKVMHPANLEAIRYILFEEILSDKSMEEILMTPQPYPYREQIDMVRHPRIRAEFEAVAEEANRGRRSYGSVKNTGGHHSLSGLLDRTRSVRRFAAESVLKAGRI